MDGIRQNLSTGHLSNGTSPGVQDADAQDVVQQVNAAPQKSPAEEIERDTDDRRVNAFKPPAKFTMFWPTAWLTFSNRLSIRCPANLHRIPTTTNRRAGCGRPLFVLRWVACWGIYGWVNNPANDIDSNTKHTNATDPANTNKLGQPNAKASTGDSESQGDNHDHQFDWDDGTDELLRTIDDSIKRLDQD